MSARPVPEAILELMARPRWVVWRYEEREGKPTKPPFNAETGDRADITDPLEWRPYAVAEAAAADFDGVGFTPAGEYTGVDLDHCLEPETLTLAPWAWAIVDRLQSYTEITPSGTGVRVWVRGALPPGGRVKRGLGDDRTGAVEMYTEGRYFTVTGDHLRGTPPTIERRSAELAALHAEIFPPPPPRPAPPHSGPPPDLDDVALLDRARHAANGDKFRTLYDRGDLTKYGSASEADLALGVLLAFWTQRDLGRMDRLFRGSGLMRAKWDERRGATTYGALTLATACAKCQETYDPHYGRAPEAESAAVSGAGAPPGAEAATAPAPPTPARATGFRSADEVMDDPPPMAVVAGVVWRRGVTVLVSESGAGKTFLLLDLSAAVQAAQPWQGRDVQPGSVAYVSFEGDALGLRFRALREAGLDLRHLHVHQAAEPLSPRVERDGTETPSAGELLLRDHLATLAAQLATTAAPPLTLLIVDTVRASLVGSEDSSEAVSAYLRAIRRLLAPYPEAGAILAHHAGWQDGDTTRKRERGSSAFRGNVDGTLYLEVTDENLETGVAALALTTRKARDAAKAAPLALLRTRVTLATCDPTGQPERTCRIEADPRSRQDRADAQARAAAEATAALDQQALALIAQGQITSIKGLRLLLGVKYDVADAILVRLVQAGHVQVPGRRRTPYTVTAPYGTK